VSSVADTPPTETNAIDTTTAVSTSSLVTNSATKAAGTLAPCVDPAGCDIFSTSAGAICKDAVLGSFLQKACPVLCQSCATKDREDREGVGNLQAALTPGAIELLALPGTTYMCQADTRCKLCAPEGRCQRCQHSSYLFNGRCVRHASACSAAGLVPVGGAGDSAYGRACVRKGDVCRFNSKHSCRSPKILGDCLASRVTHHNATCIECEGTAWLANGVCKRRLLCGRGNVYEETGTACNCNKRLGNGEIDHTCKRCYALKEPSKGGSTVFYRNPKGVITECSSCKAPYLMHGGQCIPPTSCPRAMAQYSVGSSNGRCETPFACIHGQRQDGDTPGRRCKCSNSRLCRKCVWNAGSVGHQCTRCKKRTLLLNGECITAARCIGQGLIPVETGGTQGGRCIRPTSRSDLATDE